MLIVAHVTLPKETMKACIADGRQQHCPLPVCLDVRMTARDGQVLLTPHLRCLLYVPVITLPSRSSAGSHWSTLLCRTIGEKSPRPGPKNEATRVVK